MFFLSSLVFVVVVVVLPIKVIPASQGMSVKRVYHILADGKMRKKKSSERKKCGQKKKQYVRRIKREMPIANKNKQTKTKRKEIFL